MSDENQVLAELKRIQDGIADLRERLATLESYRQAEVITNAATVAEVRELGNRVRTLEGSRASVVNVDRIAEKVTALEIASGVASTKLAAFTGVGGLIVGAAIAYLAGVVFGG